MQGQPAKSCPTCCPYPDTCTIFYGYPIRIKPYIHLNYSYYQLIINHLYIHIDVQSCQLFLWNHIEKKLSLPGVFVNDFPHQSPPGAPDHECKDDGSLPSGDFSSFLNHFFMTLSWSSIWTMKKIVLWWIPTKLGITCQKSGLHPLRGFTNLGITSKKNDRNIHSPSLVVHPHLGSLKSRAVIIGWN